MLTWEGPPSEPHLPDSPISNHQFGPSDRATGSGQGKAGVLWPLVKALLELAGWWLVGASWLGVVWMLMWLGVGEWGDR